jgi:cardiolipin synthase
VATLRDTGEVPSGDGPAHDDEGLDRILTVPNFLSVLRLLCVPLFLYLLFGRDNRAGAAFLMLGLGCTDWVDGFIARRYNQVTTLGKILDPVADRILIGVSVVAVLIDGSVPAWIAWAAISREVLVSLGTMVLAAMGARRIDVTLAGKAGTFLLMGTFPSFLVSNDDNFPLQGFWEALGWGLAIAGLSLAWYAAITYIPTARRALEEGRQGRHVPKESR